MKILWWRYAEQKKVVVLDLDEISEVRYENIVVERFLRQVHVRVKKIG